ncbi:hypothetical protein [Sinorhizobium americanum]|uniref:Uncharacterized protein n=1 Tax=Sinorhizobium americanum TaxID=194963 RepID=A0A4R2BS52_9HYPH|nr:hypothetical protein [Sinorhizobium americanum]TCN30316.1 hypothetical protein EV184_108190 [Sinorhizobium americanum]
MSDLLPILEGLQAAQTDAERARWLLAAPPSTILEEHLEIRAIVAAAGFVAGLTAVAAEISALCAVRDRHGYTPDTIIMSRNIARADLAVIAYQQEENRTCR